MFKFIDDIVERFDLHSDIAEPLKAELQRAMSEKIEHNCSETSKMLLMKELEIKHLRRKKAKRG